MKKRWICRLLEEAPIPALVPTFAVSQSGLVSDPERAPLAGRRPLVTVQVEEGVERSLD